MKHASLVGHALKVAAAAAALALAGCRTRTLEITSDPPGALVWLNDEQIGRTPLEVGFVHHGTYDVRVRLDGYLPLVTQRSTGASFEDQPGVDFVSQSFPGDSRTHWFFTLDPLPELADRNAAEAAINTRAKAFRDTMTGVTPAPEPGAAQPAAEPPKPETPTPESPKSEPPASTPPAEPAAPAQPKGDAGTPTTVTPSATSLTTTAPAPTTAR